MVDITGVCWVPGRHGGVCCRGLVQGGSLVRGGFDGGVGVFGGVVFWLGGGVY